MSSEPPFIIVTGAGRSGTSAVARVLHESGVRMGSSLAPPSEANPEGFYEDLDVVALNERILSDAGMSDVWRPERWPSRSALIDAAAPYRDAMLALVANASGGWKDPRFAITLEAWLAALPARPRVIVCLRSPDAYADSVTHVYGLVKPERAAREWARHYRRLLAVMRAHKLAATCVEYDALIEQPREVIAELSRFVGRPLDARYIVPALRRQQAPVPERYRSLYERVARLGDGPRPKGQGPRVKERVEGSFAEFTVERSEGLRTGSSRVETKGYGALVESLLARLVTGRAAWESVVNMPSFEQADEVRWACEAYNSLLTEAQLEIAALVPPETLTCDYEELRRRVNVERMVAHLAFAATAEGGERTTRAAIRAWRRFGRVPIGGGNEGPTPQ